MCKMDEPFSLRNATVDVLLDRLPAESPVKRVYTIQVASFDELIGEYEKAIAAEYEGGMARNAAAPYESGQGKRSKNLQKMKEFIDHEFEIIDAEEGRGKDAGTVGAFVCRTAPGTYPEGEKGAPLAGAEPQEFRVRLRATYARRAELFAKPEQWRAKKLTVKFKRWTAYAIPYIPIGTAIRDYE